MEPVTTIADIIEEHTGRGLTPDNLRYFDKMSDEDLARLGRAVYEHSDSDYVSIPVAEEGEECYLLHPDRPLQTQLGGIEGGWGQRITLSPREMAGNLYLALTYFPRVAVHEDLEYFLDYYDYFKAPNEGVRKSVMSLLAFYASIRDLIRRNEFILIPRTVWGPVLTVRGHDREFLKAIRSQVARSPFVREQPRTKRVAEQLGSGDEHYVLEEHREVSSVVDQASLIVANSIALDSLQVVESLLLMGSSFNYDPVFETIGDQLVFDALARSKGFDFEGGARGAHRIQQQQVLVPLLGNLTAQEFLQARDADAFASFRESLEDIGREAERLADSPVDLREMIVETLKQGRARVEREVSRSQVISGAVGELRDMTIGVITGSALAAAVNPDWVDDPWKLLTVGGAAGSSKVLLSLIRHHRARKKVARVTRLFTKLIEGSSE